MALRIVCLLLLASSTLALLPGWTCPLLPPHPTPTNVRQLRPNDFSLVMAIGDSMTAAFAAKDTDILNGLIEYRSDSWAIGADPTAVTTFNFFNYFNASTAGGAVANTLPIDVYMLEHNLYWEVDPMASRLNAAVSEAQLQNIGEQVEYLSNYSRTLYGDEAADGWKFLAILIGANDLCGACPSDYHANSNPAVWLPLYDSFLEEIYAKMPKTFVAIHFLLNISQVWDVMMRAPTYKKDYCMFVREKFHECGCLDSGNPADFLAMDNMAQTYNAGLLQIAEKWQARNLTDFYVTAIPFLSNMTVINTTFVSELDCFHPSALAHEGFAVSLWNSLFVPFDQRLNTIPTTLWPVCPTDDMFLM